METKGGRGIGRRRLAGGTRHGGEAPPSTVTDAHTKVEKKRGGRKREVADDIYLGRSSAEVSLGRCWWALGAKATATLGEAVMGLRRGAVEGPKVARGRGGAPARRGRFFRRCSDTGGREEAS
jgi:hypothetical protein